tara:strand:- start:298 stop:1560 length:1263 start_codon:yes stop_codon:yes gene_type:complete
MILDKHPYYIDQFNNMVFSRIPFDYGELTVNLKNSKEYFLTYSILFPELEDMRFYTARYPLISILISTLSSISENFYFIIVTKNLLFFSIFFWSAYYYTKYNNHNKIQFFIILILIFYNPYNFHVASNWYFADFANALLLPCFYLILVSKVPYKDLIIFCLLIVLFFSKSSMTVFCFIFPFVILVNEFIYRKKIVFLPILAIIFSSIIWGGHSYNKTGYFAFFLNSSSFSQLQLSLAQNERFNKIYPQLSIDVLQYTLLDTYKEKEKYGISEIKDEWDFNRLFKNRNKIYIKENFEQVVFDAFLKLKFILFGFKKDAGNIQDYEKNEINYFMILNKIILNISIFFVISNLIKKIIMKKKPLEEIYFIFILGLIIPVYLIGWVTSKHLVGICNTAALYLFVNYNFMRLNYKIFNFYKNVKR